MPQMHLYVPEAMAAEIKRRAADRGMTVSRYLAEVVRHEVADDWPAGYFKTVVGGWHGGPLRRPRQLAQGARDRL